VHLKTATVYLHIIINKSEREREREREQKMALEERRDCADTHHGVASGAGQGSIEQPWTSCAVEFSAVVVCTG
jgi:hypothetical protein